ncbi:MAG: hypothetical protein PF513_02285, partial [Tenericutes bacterium]|nr:hypothetical protein [Mycoplasmatota bacterium]
MKKIIGLVIFLLLFVTVLGCQDVITTEVNTDITTEETTTDEITTDEITTEETTTETPTTETPTTEMPTTSDPYDNRGLVAEECQSIDNLDEWQPVWCDEFDVDGLPSSDHWAYDVGGDGWGNGELQYYTDSDLDNAFVQDGILNIQAIKEQYD